MSYVYAIALLVATVLIGCGGTDPITIEFACLSSVTPDPDDPVITDSIVYSDNPVGACADVVNSNNAMGIVTTYCACTACPEQTGACAVTDGGVS